MPLYAAVKRPFVASIDDKIRVRNGGPKAAEKFTADLRAQGLDGNHAAYHAQGSVRLGGCV